MKKKWGFGVLFLLLAVMISAIWLVHTQDSWVHRGSTQQSASEDTVPFTEPVQEQVHKGDLLLVNHQYPIGRESIKTDIVVVAKQEDRDQSYVLLDSKLMLSRQVLEQYLNLLQMKKTIDATVGGNEYHIRYYDTTSGAPIYVPKHDDYDISGDNKQGIIVTVRKEAE